MWKRLFDIVASVCALAVLGPWLLALAVWIRLDSPGEAIFRQRRAGWRGKPFVMLKFRTMRTDADPFGASPRGAEDPRMTRVGRFLREKSLDELPQLWNILVGDMSVVGPRPLYERQAALWTPRQRRRLYVRPGLTGYAQACGRGGMTIEEKIEHDLYYVENASFRLDMRIIWQTVLNALHGEGEIYEQRYSRDQLREADAPDEEQGGEISQGEL